MGLFRTVSNIDGNFRRKLKNFPTPLYFAPPLSGFPLELGIDQVVRIKPEWRGYQTVENILM